ncbi:MAG: hypothetical protein WKG07_36045 [Hymenobacter sp.]
MASARSPCPGRSPTRRTRSDAAPSSAGGERVARPLRALRAQATSASAAAGLDRGRCTLLVGRLSRCAHRSTPTGEPPAVGDLERWCGRSRPAWAAWRGCVPRRSAFVRHAAGAVTGRPGGGRERRRGVRRGRARRAAQPAAAPERYLALAWQSGATPDRAADEGRPRP